MAKGFKARGLKGGNGGSNVDWKAIHDQVDEGTQGARISVMIDLGMHKEGHALGSKGYTGFIDADEAEEWIEEMTKKYGEKHSAIKDGLDVEDPDDTDYDEDKTKTITKDKKGNWVETEKSPKYVVAANEFGGEREYQELAIFADLTENRVDYGEEIGDKPFRVMLNRRWQGEINGFQLKKSPPAQKGGVWTVKGNTKLAELATATGHKELLECDLEDADWSEMLGEGFNITIEKSGDEGQYLNIGKCVALKKKKGVVEEVEELDGEPILITFDDATVEDLEAAHVRRDVIEKIKKASDYEGSQIQKAIEEYEARLKSKSKDSSDDDSDEDEAEDEEQTQRKVVKLGKPKGKTKTKSSTDDEDQGDEDQSDNEENWEE